MSGGYLPPPSGPLITPLMEDRPMPSRTRRSVGPTTTQTWPQSEPDLRTALQLPGGRPGRRARDDAAARLYPLMLDECFGAAVRAGARAPNDVAENSVSVWWVGAPAVARTYLPDRPLVPYARQSLRYVAIGVTLRQPRAHASIDDLPLVGGREEDPAAVAERRDLLASVDVALTSLPDRYQAVLVMWFRDGLSAPEIALALKVAQATVYVWIHRALAILRQKMTRRPS